MKTTLLSFGLLLSLSAWSQSGLRLRLSHSADSARNSYLSYTIRLGNKIVRMDSARLNETVVINGLAPGRYSIATLENNEFSETERLFEIGVKGVNNLQLLIMKRPAGDLENVLVTNGKRQMNTTDATISAVLTKKEIEALPIEGRDITRSFIRLPNLTLAVLNYNEAPNVAVNGLSGIYSNYLIDGMDNNERFLGNVKFNTPFGFTESVQVLTSNYSVEFGNTPSGVFNVTTRSGTNNYTGEVFYVTRPGKITDSRSAFAGLDLYGNPVKDGFQRHQLGVGLGGPIVKDKTFFYINLEQTNDVKDNLLTSPLLGVNETVQGKNFFTYASGKIDHNFSKNFKSSLRANYGRFNVDVQGGGLTGGVLFPSAASAQKNRTYLVALRNEYRLGSNLKAETNFQHSYFNWNYRDNPAIGSPGANVLAPNGTLIASVGPANYIFNNDEYTQQIQQKFRWETGRHKLLAGAEFLTSDYKLLGAGNQFGFYTVRLTDPQLAAIRAQNLGSNFGFNNIPADAQVLNYLVDIDRSIFGTRQNIYNLYLEDNIAVTNRLRINLGVRWDYDNLSKGGGTKGDYNNLAPRVSFNYQLNEDNIFRGGIGIFTDKIKYSVVSDALQFSNNSDNFKRQLAELQRLGILSKDADLNRITHPGNLRAFFDGAASPAFGKGPNAEQAASSRQTQSAGNYRIKNPDGLSNPQATHITMGYQRRVAENTVLSVDLINVETRNLFRLRNLNSASSYPLNNAATAVVRTPAQANATRPVPVTVVNGQFEAIIGGQNYRGIARDIFMTEAAGKASYLAMNLVLDKARGNSNFAYHLVYSLSRFKTDAEGINVRATDNNNFEAEYSFGDNDRTHVLTGYFSWFPLRNLSITPAILYQSGQPITRFANAASFGGVIDLNGNGETAYGNGYGPADYQPGEIRNMGGRLPGATTFDLSIKYRIQPRNFGAIELSADVFNLLNALNYTGFNSARAVSNQIQVGPASQNNLTIRSAATPRQFQFGSRFIF